jgi:hypothetical protein
MGKAKLKKTRGVEKGKAGEPQINESGDIFEGIFKKIVKYDSKSRSYNPLEKGSRVVTTFLLEGKKGERRIDFLCYVGRELIGERVKYADSVITKRTWLNEVKNNLPTYKKFKKEERIVQVLIPDNENFGTYAVDHQSFYSAQQ